jgi:hypothetical protein
MPDINIKNKKGISLYCEYSRKINIFLKPGFVSKFSSSLEQLVVP